MGRDSVRGSIRSLGIVLALVCVVFLVGVTGATPVSEATAGQPAGDSLADGPISADLDEDEGEEDGDDETGPRLISEWWGLGGEADEAPYMGLVELGVVVLSLGVVGYSAGKRTSLVPLKHRLRLLQAHEVAMLTGTALVVPHFLAVEEWEGLGLLVAVLLGIEVASGLYGRHLHRHVIRHGRGEEISPLLGRVVELTKRKILLRWRRVHILLTFVTAAVLVLHIVTAVGD